MLFQLRHIITSLIKRRLGLLESSSLNTCNKPLLSADEISDIRNSMQSFSYFPVINRSLEHCTKGETESAFRGQGMDYDESRPYQSGDEIRYMNWRQTAKAGEFFMKSFREERQPGVCIVLDRRSAMRFGTRTQLKVTQAARAAISILFSLQLQNYSVSSVILQNQLCWIDDAQGEAGLFSMIHQMCTACEPVSYQSAKTNETSLITIIRQLDNVLTPGTLLYFISDFHDLQEQHRGDMWHLCEKHKVHAIHIHDPAEHALPNAGLLKLTSLNNAENCYVNTYNQSAIDYFSSACETYFANISRIFSSLDISYRMLSTEIQHIESDLFSPGN